MTTYTSPRELQAQKRKLKRLEEESIERGRGFYRGFNIDAGLWTRIAVYVGVTLIAVSPLLILYHQINVSNHRQLYRNAEKIAEMTIGDKKGGLTTEEKQRWYEKMGVKNDCYN